MPPDIVDPVLLVPVGALGLVFGSFVTALSYRLPRGESIARGRSKCPACGKQLEAVDLVPVFSWIAQRGRCRACGTKISARYPLIEAVTAGLFLGAALLAHDLRHMIVLMAMTPLMVALAVIDIEHRRLPNSLLALLAVLAVTWRFIGDNALLVAVVTGGAAFVIGVLLDAGFHALTGKRGLGMGDTKLFALMGLALPVGPFLLSVSLAGILGVIFGAVRRSKEPSGGFPFGPAILASFWASLVAGERAVNALVYFLSG